MKVRSSFLELNFISIHIQTQDVWMGGANPTSVLWCPQLCFMHWNTIFILGSINWRFWTIWEIKVSKIKFLWRSSFLEFKLERSCKVTTRSEGWVRISVSGLPRWFAGNPWTNFVCCSTSTSTFEQTRPICISKKNESNMKQDLTSPV